MAKRLIREGGKVRIVYTPEKKKRLTRTGTKKVIEEVVSTPTKQKRTITRVGDFVTERRPDGTVISYKAGLRVGQKYNEAEKLKRKVGTYQGTFNGKVYSGVEVTEVLSGKLDPNTRGRFNPAATRKRENFVDSKRKFEQGRATSRDLLNVVSGGTGVIRNILLTKGQAEYLVARNQYSKDLSKIARDVLDPISLKKYDGLRTVEAKQTFLSKQIDRKIKEIKGKPVVQKKKSRALSKFSARIASKLENWAAAINSRTKAAEKRSAKKQAELLAGKIARKELVDSYFPKGTKRVGKVLNSIINLGESTFKGLLDLGNFFGSATEKTVFLLPAFGKAISSGKVAEYSRLVNPFVGESAALLKEIYTDPKTYRDAAIGAAVAAILAGPTKLKRPIYNMKELPPSVKGVKTGTIIKAGNRVGMVAKNGKVVRVPRDLGNDILGSVKKGKVLVKKDLPKVLFKKQTGREAAIKKITQKELKTTNIRYANYYKRTLSDAKALQKDFLTLEKIFAGKKAQAGKGRRISKPELRRRSAGLPKKQGRLRVDKGEYIQKSPKKGGVEDSLRFNPQNKQLTLSRKVKNQRTTMVIDKNFNVIKSDIRIGKGPVRTLGNKGFKRPASQVKTFKGKLTPKTDAEFLVYYKNSGSYLQAFKGLKSVKADVKQIANNAKLIERGKDSRLLLTTKQKTQLKTPKQKLKLTAKNAQQQKAKVSGRERVRAQLLKKLAEKKKLFEAAKATKADIPKVPKKVPKKITKTQVSREIQVIKKGSKTVSKRLNNFDRSLATAQNKFGKVGRIGKSELSRLSQNIKGIGRSVFRVNSQVFSLASSIALAVSVDISSALKRDLLKINDQTNKQLQDYILVKKQLEELVKKQIKKPTPRIISKATATKKPVKKTPSKIIKPKVPKKPSRKPRKETKKEPEKPLIPIIKKITWKTKLPKGYKRKVDGYVKIGNRGYKVVSGLPENKAWNKVYSKGGRKYRSVDRSVARSFELRIVGITKAKDDARKVGVKKVRAKRSKDPRVLPLVERSKFAIDTTGEKQGLKVRRGTKKKLVRKKNRTKKQ